MACCRPEYTTPRWKRSKGDSVHFSDRTADADLFANMNDMQEKLELTREQLARAERALEAIQLADVLPINKARYELMTDGYVEQIQRLRAQIDAYLGND